MPGFRDQAEASPVYDGTMAGKEYGNSYDPGFAAPSPSSATADVSAPLSPKAERALIAKIDFRLIPVLTILYLLAFIDRTNIANAAVYGLADDLGVPKGSNDYNTSLTLFFILYVLCEIPSNILLKKLKPHVWLSACMSLFGLLTIIQGLVTSIGGLYVVRLFLGLAESGMFPGCFYLIGMWYKRSEAQKRFSFFFSSATLAGAFSGLLAAALSNMDGIRGYRAWRWVFIIGKEVLTFFPSRTRKAVTVCILILTEGSAIEGLLTVVVSFLFFFIIPDFPENSKFLTAREKEFVRTRIEDEQGKTALERAITFRDVVNVLKDYKVITAGFMYFGLIVPAYGYAFFAPLIIAGFNYNAVQTQLHSVPPWAVAFGWAMVLAYFSDLVRHRFMFIMISIAAAISGFAVMLSPLSFTIKYGALFLVTSGIYGAMPLVVCWFNMNLGGHHRRAIGSAWQIGFGNIGGIISTYAFLNKDAPSYRPGYAISIAFTCLSAVSCFIYLYGCITANKRRQSTTDRGQTDWEKTELGDQRAEYRYMI